MLKNLPARAGDVGEVGSVPRLEGPLEEGMATHSSNLAWRIPWTEEPRILVLPAESSPAPLSLNEDQLKTLINKSSGRWYPMKWLEMKEMLKHFAGILACLINVCSHYTKCS